MHDLLLRLYESLTPEQRAKVAFDWHYTHPVLGLLRRRIENDWRITKPRLASTFYTPAQQTLLREIFFGLLDPAWHERFEFVLSEDSGGYGEGQSMAIFGTPGETPLEIVITSRHLTLRYNTDAAEPCAFGGPIFYAHEGPQKNALETSTNVFWPQAVRATQLLESLPAELQSQALSQEPRPAEGHIDLAHPLYADDGLQIAAMPSAARERAGELFAELLAPFRPEDRQRAHECVESLGGLEACRLTFYPEGDQLEGVYRCWRLHGPGLLWYFRGTPHIHVWVHISSDPTVHANAANSYDLLGWRFPNSRHAKNYQGPHAPPAMPKETAAR